MNKRIDLIVPHRWEHIHDHGFQSPPKPTEHNSSWTRDGRQRNHRTGTYTKWNEMKIRRRGERKYFQVHILSTEYHFCKISGIFRISQKGAIPWLTFLILWPWPIWSIIIIWSGQKRVAWICHCIRFIKLIFNSQKNLTNNKIWILYYIVTEENSCC